MDKNYNKNVRSFLEEGQKLQTKQAEELAKRKANTQFCIEHLTKQISGEMPQSSYSRKQLKKMKLTHIQTYRQLHAEHLKVTEKKEKTANHLEPSV